MEEKKSYIEQLLGDLKNLNSEDAGMELIAALLNLDDENFENLAGVYLLEMQKSLSSSKTQMTMAQMLDSEGITLEQLRQDFEKNISKIDSELGDILSDKKRDFLRQVMILVYNSVAETEGISKKIIQIPIEKCHEDAKIPVYANLTDAGADLYAIEDIVIAPGETVLIPTGLKVAIPRGYEIQVRPKSGRALKTKMRVANSPGTIDAGYRDEIKVIIDNIEPPFKDINYHFDDEGKVIIDSILHGSSYSISKGDKFAQLVLSEVPKMDFVEVESVSKYTGNRGGGFGSTGIKNRRY